jgi:hypothetical protein
MDRSWLLGEVATVREREDLLAAHERVTGQSNTDAVSVTKLFVVLSPNYLSCICEETTRDGTA